MNKKTKTKILTLSAVSALSLAAIWVLASNPKLEFDTEVKQDAHLELSGVTLIAPTQSSNFDVSFKMSWDQLITLTGTNTAGNSVQGNGTLSFWGNNNKTNDSESLILGGSSNEIANTAKANIIAASQWVKTAGEGTTNHGTGNVILASSGVNLTGNSNILRAGNSTKIHGNDNLTLATDKVNISANNSMAIGGNITINHNGSFVFNGTPDPVTTRKPNTAIINTSNGMIINANANTTTTNNTGLTVNGSLQVGNSQIDTDGAIISDGCIKLKGISNGEIGLGCRNSSNTDGPFLSFEEVECGKNAKHYEINDRQVTWPFGSKNSDFCSKGRLDGEAPKFFDSEDRAAAYKTRGGSYASEWFGYTFHICFNEQDPTCALPKLKKSWTCSDAKGNRLHCEATQDLGKKDPKQTPVSCPSGQHLENGKCISNTKTVDCDKTWINTANGSVNTSQVAITRSESTKSWSKPAKCDFTCNTGYRKDDSNSHNIHCAKLEEKTCTVKINEVSCKYNEEKDQGDRYINYTYDSSCPSEKHAIIWDSNLATIWSWNKGFRDDSYDYTFDNQKSYSTDFREVKNSDWSITRTKLLSPPWWIGGPDKFYIKVVLWKWQYNGRKFYWEVIGSLWQENWQIFEVNRREIQNKGECYRRKSLPKPEDTFHQTQKVDWYGKPFEWEKYMIYMEWWDNKPIKLGPLNAVRTGNRIWDREDNRDTGITPWNIIVSWLSNSGGRRPKLYMPYNSNSWVAFEIEPWSSWKITRVQQYIGVLEK